MTDQQKLLRDIDTLKESIRLNHADLDKLVLTPSERAEIRESIKWCISELCELLARFDGASPSN